MRHDQLLAQILQLQCDVAIAQIQCSELKEYDLSWLPGSKKVTRDRGTGKFAKKVESFQEAITESTGTVAKKLSQLKKVNPAKAVESKLLIAANRVLESIIARNPKFASQLTERMFGVDAEQARSRLAEKYAEINPELANAIRPDPFKDILQDVLRLQADHKSSDAKILAKDISRAFEYSGYKYNKLIDTLNHLEGQPESIQAMGRIAATSIPISVYLAAVLTPEFAIGAMTGSSLSSILVSAAVGQAASVAANKAMDKAHVDNPIARIAIDVAVSIGAGISIQKVAKSLEKKAATTAEKTVAKNVAAKAEKQANTAKVSFEAASKKATTLSNQLQDQFKSDALDEFLSSAIQKKLVPSYGWDEQVKELTRTFQKAGRSEINNLLDKAGCFDKALNEAKTVIEEAILGKVEEESLKAVGAKAFRKGLDKAIAETFADPEMPLHIKSRLDAYGISYIDGKWITPRIPKKPSVDASRREYSHPDATEGDLSAYCNVGTIFDDVNSALRGLKPLDDSVLEMINKIRGALSARPRYKPSEPMSRFIAMPEEWIENLKEGGTLQDPAFQSFSRKSQGAGNFSDETFQNVKYILHPSTESVGRDITMLNSQGEYEVLFSPGSKFKIIRKTQEDFAINWGAGDIASCFKKKWVIELQEHE